MHNETFNAWKVIGVYDSMHAWILFLHADTTKKRDIFGYDMICKMENTFLLFFRYILEIAQSLDLGPVYLLVRRPLIDLLLDLLVKGLGDLLPVSIYSSLSKSIS